MAASSYHIPQVCLYYLTALSHHIYQLSVYIVAKDVFEWIYGWFLLCTKYYLYDPYHSLRSLYYKWPFLHLKWLTS